MSHRLNAGRMMVAIARTKTGRHSEGTTTESESSPDTGPRTVIRDEPRRAIGIHPLKAQPPIPQIDSTTVEPWLCKVHTGDCIDIMGRMPAESVDVIVTSPPYNIKNSTGNGLKNGSGGKWPRAGLINGYDSHDDAMPHDEYVRWQRECLHAMMRILKDDGAIFYNHKWRIQGGLLQDRADIVEGFPVRQIIIWQRAGGINFNPGYFLPTYEVIYLIAKPGFRLAPKANAQGDVWTIFQEMNNPHPAAFPVELAQRCIESTAGRVVLDPFMGSGTTAIAAVEAQRDWIGIDVSEHYCRVAQERIAAHRDGHDSATSEH